MLNNFLLLLDKLLKIISTLNTIIYIAHPANYRSFFCSVGHSISLFAIRCDHTRPRQSWLAMVGNIRSGCDDNDERPQSRLRNLIMTTDFGIIRDLEMHSRLISLSAAAGRVFVAQTRIQRRRKCWARFFICAAVRDN